MEEFRQLIHLIGLGIIGLIQLFSIYYAFILVLGGFLGYMVFEVLRAKFKIYIPLYHHIVEFSKRSTEKEGVIFAPLYYGIGLILLLAACNLALVSLPVTFSAIAILAFGDSVASIVGLRLGRNPLPFNRNKTFEGSISGFIVASIAAACFIHPWLAVLGSITGIVVEALPISLNDNFTMLLATATAMALAGG